jgi:hypothetical protein
VFKYCSVSLRRIYDPNDPGRFTDRTFYQIIKSHIYFTTIFFYWQAKP